MKENTAEKTTVKTMNTAAETAMRDGWLNWYVGYCPPMREFKTQAALAEKGFMSYLLVKEKTRNRSGMRNAPKSKRSYTVTTPSLSGTIFFAMDRARPRWVDLRARPQVLSSIMCHQGSGAPALVNTGELIRMIDKHDAVGPAFKRGDLVKSLDTAFPIEAAILSVRGKLAKLDVQLLGRSVEVSFDRIEKIA